MRRTHEFPAFNYDYDGRPETRIGKYGCDPLLEALVRTHPELIPPELVVVLRDDPHPWRQRYVEEIQDQRREARLSRNRRHRPDREATGDLRPGGAQSEPEADASGSELEAGRDERAIMAKLDEQRAAEDEAAAKEAEEAEAARKAADEAAAKQAKATRPAAKARAKETGYQAEANG